MSQIVVIGPYPLYRLSVVNLLRRSGPRMSFHEASSLARVSPGQMKGAKGIVLCGQVDPDATLGDRLLNAGCELTTLRVLFSDRCGNAHRQLFSEGVVDLIMPMAVSWGDAERYLRRLLVELDPSAGVAALDDPVLAEQFLPDFDDLTQREQRLLHHLQQGLSNEIIAEQMAININTVKVHMAKICRKTGIRNRTHAVSLFNQILSSGY